MGTFFHPVRLIAASGASETLEALVGSSPVAAGRRR